MTMTPTKHTVTPAASDSDADMLGARAVHPVVAPAAAAKVRLHHEPEALEAVERVRAALVVILGEPRVQLRPRGCMLGIGLEHAGRDLGHVVDGIEVVLGPEAGPQPVVPRLDPARAYVIITLSSRTRTKKVFRGTEVPACCSRC